MQRGWHQHSHDEPGATTELLAQIDALAEPLNNDDDLTPLMERTAGARVVVLGTAAHGAADLLSWRARLTRRLIREQGFSFVVVDADWTECSPVDRYVKGLAGEDGGAAQALAGFHGWPSWVWANTATENFVEWLRESNLERPANLKVGFYGLDVFSFWESLRSVVSCVEQRSPDNAAAARRAIHLFEPFSEEAALETSSAPLVPDHLFGEMVGMLERLRHDALAKRQSAGREDELQLAQHAGFLQEAPGYYRTFLLGGAAAWNQREQHLMVTLERLMAHHGPEARAIVWQHDARAGDARYSALLDDGLISFGQLVREKFAERAVLVGSTAYEGSVLAASGWGAPPEAVRLPHARYGSWEALLHDASARDKMLIFPKRLGTLESLLQPRGHRAVGVIYKPEMEHVGNYVPTIMPGRYDALLYLDVTSAARPLFVAPGGL